MSDIITLPELDQGEEGIVTSLSGGHGVQERLRTLGIVEGQRVRKLSSLALGGPVILLINRAQVAVGRGMARKIFVKRI